MISESNLSELQKALASIEKSGTPDFQQIHNLIIVAREARARIPEHIYRHGKEALRRYQTKMSPDELWSLKEDVAIAALHLGYTDEAWTIIEEINRKFPDSSRASRLLGAHFEATGNLADASALYSKELEKDPQNGIILRRLMAAKKGQGDLVGAAEALSLYLGTHMVDTATWEEAAAIYLRLGALPQAVFCLEEVVLMQPGNINAQMLLADALYTSGGATNWLAARGYYCGVVEATGGSNARALLGVGSCTAQLRGSAGRSGGASASANDGAGAAVSKLAGEALVQAYAVAGGAEKLQLVKELIMGQGNA